MGVWENHKKFRSRVSSVLVLEAELGGEWGSIAEIVSEGTP